MIPFCWISSSNLCKYTNIYFDVRSTELFAKKTTTLSHSKSFHTILKKIEVVLT